MKAVGQIHAIINATPDGGALRERYAEFLRRWSLAHKGGHAKGKTPKTSS